MKDTIYISGHRNPDTDSICATVCYAYLKNIISDKNYIPIRLGDINNETKFVLDYFNVPEPNFMDTIRLKVSDLEYVRVSPLKSSVTVKKAEEYLLSNSLDYIAVSDKKNKLKGMLTISNLNKVYTNEWKDNVLFDSKTTIEHIVETFDAKILNINNDMKYFPGKIWIAASNEENIKNNIKNGDIVIIGDRDDVQKVLVDIGVSLIILTGGAMMNVNLLLQAVNKGITVISANCDSLSAARLLFLSIPISYVMADNNLIAFNADELVKDVKNTMVKNRYRAYPVLDDNGYVLGMMSRYNLLSKDKKKIILVDHNEYTQAIDGIEEAEIVEVIDHHRVADLQSAHPIFLRNEPVGSTSTIVAKLYFESGIEMPKNIAGLLMSGIISDTLLFKSPTCTEEDINMCNRLAVVAQISDINNYFHEMLMVSTSLHGKSVSDIFRSDFKEFKIDEYKVGISQFNTIDFSSFDNMKIDMINYMNDMIKNYDILMLVLTNIIDEGSLFLCVGNIHAVEMAFDVKLINNEAYVKGILSRKKQIVPILSKYLSDDEE